MLLRNPKVCLTEHDGYPFDRVVTKRRLHFFWDLIGAALEKGGLTEEGADRLILVVGVVFGKSGPKLV